MADKREFLIRVTGDTFRDEVVVVGFKNAMHQARSIARCGLHQAEFGDRQVFFPAHRVNLVEVEAILPETPQEPLV